MTPTPEQVEAVARTLRDWWWSPVTNEMRARRILTTQSAEAQAALAASLPVDVLLAALKEQGVEVMRVRDSQRVIQYAGDEVPEA